MPNTALLVPVEITPQLQAGLQRLIDVGRSALSEDEIFELLAVNLQFAIALHRRGSACASLAADGARLPVTVAAT